MALRSHGSFLSESHPPDVRRNLHISVLVFQRHSQALCVAARMAGVLIARQGLTPRDANLSEMAVTAEVSSHLLMHMTANLRCLSLYLFLSLSLDF